MKDRSGSPAEITITSVGVSGLVFTDSGAAYISPAPDYGAGAHVVYYVKDIGLPVALRCAVQEELSHVQTNASAWCRQSTWPATASCAPTG